MNLRHRGPKRRPQLRLRFPLSRARPAPRAGASALALSTRRGVSSLAAAGSGQTNGPCGENATRLREVKNFFSRLHSVFRTPPVWIVSQPGADSSRRRGRRRPPRDGPRVRGPEAAGTRPPGRAPAKGAAPRLLDTAKGRRSSSG